MARPTPETVLFGKKQEEVNVIILCAGDIAGDWRLLWTVDIHMGQ